MAFYPESLKKRARELAKEDYSAEAIANIFGQEAANGKHNFIPTGKTIRNWLNKKPLSALQPTIYESGNGSKWLRLQVENGRKLPVKNCYGKLLDRRYLSQTITQEGKPYQLQSSPQFGRRSSEHGKLPPEGYRFPWSSVDYSLTNVNISGKGGFEYLYLVVKNIKETACFWFPANAGNMYENWRIGDFDLELEIGSDSEEFTPIKVSLVFRATTNDIELVSFKTLN